MAKAKSKNVAAGETLKSTSAKTRSKASTQKSKTQKNAVENYINESELVSAENTAVDHVLKSKKKLSPIKEHALEETPSAKRARNVKSKAPEQVTLNQNDNPIENSTPMKKTAASADSVATNSKRRGKKTAKPSNVEVAVNHTSPKEKPVIPNAKESNKAKANRKESNKKDTRKRKLNNEVALKEVDENGDEPSAEDVTEAENVKNGTIEELVKEPVPKKGRGTVKKSKIQTDLKSEIKVKSELNTSVSQANNEKDDSVEPKDKNARAAKGRSKQAPSVQQTMNPNETEIEDDNDVALADNDTSMKGKRGTRKQQKKTKEVKKSSPIKAQKPMTAKKISEDETSNDVMVETETEPVVEKKSKEASGQGRKRAAQAKKDISPKKVEENGSKDVNDIEADKPVKRRKKADNSAPMNPTATTYKAEDFVFVSNSKHDSKSNAFSLKISSWNVAGVRSWLKKGGLTFLDYEKPDIFCLQEVKCTMDELPDEMTALPGYHPYWLCMPGGYAGVAIYSKIMPINVEYGIGDKEFDTAGRIITAEYEKFFLINVYVLNSGRKLVNLEERMRWEILFQKYVQKLNELKPLIICGDMNVSHQEIDLANPKSNTRSAGFTKEEREKMTALLSLGYVDTFRHLYPDLKGAYTYWTYMANARARNVGWRLDYFLVSERILSKVLDNCIRSQCLGSDHCPITLFLNI